MKVKGNVDADREGHIAEIKDLHRLLPMLMSTLAAASSFAVFLKFTRNELLNLLMVYVVC